MRKNVFINYFSIITGLGNLEESWEAIFKKHSSVNKKRHFCNSLLKETGISLYKREMEDKRLNIAYALIEDCLKDFPQIPEDTFVIWTGIKNSAEYIENKFYNKKYPEYFLEDDLCQWVMKYLGTKAGGMEISAACASSTVAVCIAAQFISEGRYENVLVIGCDFVTRFVYYGFAALKAMTEEVCRPFDRERKGLSLGDGAFALFLSSEMKSNVIISGWGITNDANHITGPSRDGEGLATSLKLAINMAGFNPSQIQAICAHGTGTSYNDTMEIKAFQSIFGNKPPLTFGVKGAIGHTLGAAGGIEIALSFKSLLENTILPTVGCVNPEADFICLDPVNFSLSNILSCNSGFGGVNASVILEKI